MEVLFFNIFIFKEIACLWRAAAAVSKAGCLKAITITVHFHRLFINLTMKGARSYLGGDIVLPFCLLEEDGVTVYTWKASFHLLHPFWLVFIVAAVRSDRPKILETTVSSTHIPLLVFCEILDGLLEMLNKLVCPWWLTLKASVLLQFLLNIFDLQKVLFLE